MALLGNYCTGFEEDLLALFAGGPGGHVETVGSLDVTANDTYLAWIEDGIAFNINLIDPANRERFRPFIDEFIEHQAALPSPS